MPVPIDTYRFGPFEVRTRTREIYKYGLKLKLRPQPFQVLQTLVERPGDLVTREELRRLLWSEETFVDFEHGLNTSIKELRQVLNDSAREPHYIETMPRLGYRLLAAVEAERTGSMSDVPAVAEPMVAMQPVNQPSPRGPLARTGRGVRYSALVAVLLVASWMTLTRQAQPEITMPVPLTSFPGLERGAAWSPDGRQVAFIWNGGQGAEFHVYVVQPGSSQTLRLTTEGGDDSRPAWSPDGRWIAYVHVADGNYSLRLVSPLGGPARTALASDIKMGGGASWMPDGRSLVLEMAEPSQPPALWVMSVDTGERRQLTWPPAGIPGDTQPAVSPDGRAVAFCRKTAWRTGELHVLDLQPGLSSKETPRRLTDLGYVEWPTWTPDGRRILFGAFREGAGLWQVSRNGGPTRPVFGVTETASFPALAVRPAGNTSLIFTHAVGTSSIWRYDTVRGSSTPPVELAASSRSQRYPSYSPDGKRLAFSSNRTGYQEIWVANADGSQPVQVTNLRHRLTEEAGWSPAGDLLAFVSQEGADRQIYVVSPLGGAPRAITNEQGIRFGGGWSHDSGVYYYTSMRSGRNEVWRATRNGSPPTQMTANGGQCGFESSRGAFYYWGLNEEPNGHAALMQRTPVGDREVSLTPGGVFCKTALSSAGFYFKAADIGDIYLYDETSGRSRRVLQHPPQAHSFTISPDGRWFAIEISRSENQDLMIMERFR